jgi:hypothetical protein
MKQPWIHGRWLDGALILAPPLLATLAVLVTGPSIEHADMPPLAWLVIVVLIDVAHVYTTIFRTYADAAARRERRALLVAVPLVAWLGGIMLYSLGELAFWRVLAYVAVFHFVRQQYGFVRIYSRNDDPNDRHRRWLRRVDATAIYAATLYPLLYWHVSQPKSFHWFVEGDFFELPWPLLERIGFAVYTAILCAYVASQAYELWRRRTLNIPKNLVVIGTALSWYVGIVAFDGDWTFTLTNVVSHGIPYFALVWSHKRRERSTLFRLRFVPVYLGIVALLAYCEEYLWDGFIWREHLDLFPWAAQLPHLGARELLTVVVPLLAVPQLTHYALDGFLWKVSKMRKAPAR